MADDFKYEIKIDKKILTILGPHLYGDTASIVAELISNSYDAGADNCWVTIRTGKTPEVIIEDDGSGMSPDEVNKYFLDIGYDRRDERPLTPKQRKVFGRKGIGKLAAFSLAKIIELYSLKDGKKAGCILNIDKITRNDEDPLPIRDEDIVFEPTRLSDKGTGTRIVLKSIKKNVNTTYYYLVNRIVRNFNLDDFQIHMIKDQEAPKTIKYSDLNYFDVMDTIVTVGDKHAPKREKVNENSVIGEKYKHVDRYSDLLPTEEERKTRFVRIPNKIKVLGKDDEEKEVEFSLEGWIGTIYNLRKLRGLVNKEGASKEEQSISINDNRVTIFSRNRIGEYDVLPSVQTNTVYDAYVIGEFYVDILEDDTLIDMAISNRRGYEETDQRYRALLAFLKPLVSYIAQRKAEVQRLYRTDQKEKEDLEASEEIREAFYGKTRTMSILKEKLDEDEREAVANENFQFMRAAQLARATRLILISHDNENKEYGFFILKIFELLGLDIENRIVFTSFVPTGVPQGVNIYDYLKDCFRDDLYVIFIFSRKFYDSNVCIAETGAAWATNQYYSNIVIDIDYADIDNPLDRDINGLRIAELGSLNRESMVQFIERVYACIGLEIPSRENILPAIEQAIIEFTGKLDTASFYPQRKFQGHPVCNRPGCGSIMDLELKGAELFYVCRTPECDNIIRSEIE